MSLRLKATSVHKTVVMNQEQAFGYNANNKGHRENTCGKADEGKIILSQGQLEHITQKESAQARWPQR